MWPESSSVNSVNLVKKIYYNSGDIEFFLGITFFGAPCISIGSLDFITVPPTGLPTIGDRAFPSQWQKRGTVYRRK